MSAQQQVRSMVAVACLAVAGNAWAQDRLIQSGTDPVSGATVRVVQGAAGVIRVEVTGAGVEVRREFAPGRASTELRGVGEAIGLVTDGRSLVLSGSSGRVAADAAHPLTIEEVRRRLAGSALVRRAVAMVGAVAVADQAPIRPVLLTTRAYLQTLAGDQPDLSGLRDWIQKLRSRVRVRPVGWADDGPEECWDAYAKEAIAAYIEYEECMYATKWWDLASQAACATIYEMRAIGAFAWWVKCVGLRG